MTYYICTFVILSCTIVTSLKYIPGTVKKHGPWTAVDESLLTGPAYAMMIDNVLTVRVMIVREQRLRCGGMQCVYYYNETNTQHIENIAYCRNLHDGDTTEQHNYYTLECNAIGHPSEVALEITGRATGTKTKTERIHVTYMPPREQQHGLAICVSPSYYLFSSYQLHKLQLFIAYYNFAGASSIFLYNHSWSTDIDTMLQNYDGFVHVIDWKFSTDNLHAVGGETWSTLGSYMVFQGFAMNHCLLESLAQGFMISAHIDIDEYIWSRVSPSLRTAWNPRLQHGWLHRFFKNRITSSSTVCGWSIANTWASAVSSSCEAILDWKRSVDVLRHGSQSKSIVVSDNVYNVVVHSVDSWAKGHTVTNMGASEMVLLHLRDGYHSQISTDEAAFTNILYNICNHMRNHNRIRNSSL
jgi:hypothetical protein